MKKLHPFGGPIKEIGALTDLTAYKYAQFFELDLEIFPSQKKTKIRPMISRYRKFDLPDANSINGILSTGFANDGFDTYYPQVPQNQTGAPSRKINPLSLWSNYKSYIIIKLSDSHHWRFSSTYYPFTISDKQPVANQLFANPTLVSVKGGNIDLYPPKPGDPPKIPMPDSRWAYFLFDGATASALTGDKYAFTFNIHVELLDPVTGTALGLIIDPDVGHPGGSGD